jgi:hypothetical protein
MNKESLECWREIRKRFTKRGKQKETNMEREGDNNELKGNSKKRAFSVYSYLRNRIAVFSKTRNTKLIHIQVKELWTPLLQRFCT